MKLKLGLLLTALMVAQAPIQAGYLGGTQSMTPQQEKSALLDAAAKYFGGGTKTPSVPTTGIKSAPAGITTEQQEIYNRLLGHFSTIAQTLRSNLIPMVKKAITGGGFGFMDGITVATSAGPTILTSILGAKDEIKALHNTSPSARIVIKSNLEKSVNAIGFKDIVNELTGLLNQLPDGIIKTQLIEYAPKLNELPGLIASQI